MSADPLWVRPEITGEYSLLVPTFEFDGRRFHGSVTYNLGAAPTLYLAYQARHGDTVAATVLNACMVTITDVHGKTYWPMEGGG